MPTFTGAIDALSNLQLGSASMPLIEEKNGFALSPSDKENPNQKVMIPFRLSAHQELLGSLHTDRIRFKHARSEMRSIDYEIRSRALNGGRFEMTFAFRGLITLN